MTDHTMTTTTTSARLSYDYNDGWRVKHPSGRTLIFARNGGVWVVRAPWMLRTEGRQIEGTSDYRAGKNNSTCKGRAARYAREFFADNF